MKISVLFKFREILLDMIHCISQTKFSFLFMSLNELLVYKIFVSSAKLCTFENEIALFRALM